MRCSICEHDNRTEAKFCEACAAPLRVECSNCGKPVSATAEICPECAFPIAEGLRGETARRFYSPHVYTPRLAERILASKSVTEGERKLVTVLFADIRGSFELIAERDPEEAEKILRPVLDRMIAAVHHYEGTISKVMGDGIMALFGAPLAHEDHAVRACYASLRMQEAVTRYSDELQRSHGLPVTIRVGLNSGDILVQAIGNDLYMDYSVVGATAHLASRMEKMAKPGSVLTTINTLRLAEGYVAARSLGLVPVKGLANAIEIFELVGGGLARGKLQVATRRGLTRFVGREDEMDRIRQALHRADGGEGQVVSVVGEPGVGKSRLVYEFVHSSDTEDWLIMEANSVSYGRATPYLPIIEFLRNYFEIDAGDSTPSISEKVFGKLAALDNKLHDAVPPILDLLDALDEDHPFHSLDPLQHRQLTYQAVTSLIACENVARPIVLVFEDLHWYDSLSLGLLNAIVRGAREARALTLVSSRPEHRDEWKALSNYTQIRLDPLGAESAAKLLEGLLGADPEVRRLSGVLLERARGNPFFVEEMARSLVETGVLEGPRGGYRLAKPLSSLEVPLTVQAVLASRIDALPPAEKRLLQEAAVIGHTAPFVLLHSLSGLEEGELRSVLDRLQTAEFLYATQLYPELQYTFKHSLTHDVAYSELVHDRRRAIHARIVEIIERLYAERLGEQLERLADHSFRAELDEKAIRYLRLAGGRAADREAYREAVILFEKALGVLAKLRESRDVEETAIDIRFELRNALQPLGDRERIAHYLREAEELADALGDKRRIGWVQSYLSEQFWMLGRYSDSVVAGERAIEIAGELSDLSLRVVTNLPLGLSHHTAGDYRRAIECFGWNATNLKGEQVRERFGMFVLPSAFSRSFIAWACADRGEFARGRAAGEDALRIAQQAEHPFSRGYAHLGLGVVSLRKGEIRRAIRVFERALAAGAFADSPVGFAYVSLHLGYALGLANRPDEGISILEESVKVAETRGFKARHALRLAYLSEVYLIAGRTDAADAVGTRALELARAHSECANEAYALRAVAEIGARRNNPPEAEARFREALALSERLGMHPLAAHCHRGLADSLAAMGQGSAAAEHRSSAAAMMQAMGMHGWTDGL